MTAVIVSLGAEKVLPCPHAGSRLPGALSLFLVRLPGDLLVVPLWSPLLPLKVKEEAESSEARRGQSFGNNGYIPRGKGPNSDWTVVFCGFPGPKVHPTEAKQLAPSEQPWG